MTIKAVFFDLDGTLLDSAPDFIHTIHQLTNEYFIDTVEELAIRNTVSDGARALTTLAFGLKEGEDGFHERWQRLLEIYTQTMGQHCELFSGMKTLVERIHNNGLLWGVITNKPERFTLPLMAKLPLPVEPDVIICPDHVTKIKPDPEALFLACEKTGIEANEVVYIGDHQRDIDCGIAAGSKTIAVSYGYIHPSVNIENWKADYIAHNSEGIWEIIEESLSHSKFP